MLNNFSDIIDYWNKQPCNINHSKKKLFSKEYFEEVEYKKYFVEPHILNFVNFDLYKNNKILEIGTGIGTDAINFARRTNDYYGLELSDKSLEITKKRFDVYNLNGNFYNINAEDNLDFLGIETFDLIYSFGVIHHSINPEKIIDNCYKLLKKGGTLKIMLYAKNSWKNIMIQNEKDQYEAQSKCPLAKTYTKCEVQELLKKFNNIKIEQEHIFPYKIPEYKNNIYIKEPWFENMPEDLFKILEKNLGWHLCISAYKN
tara:strand:- start:727 stop:1500 length:774 start_codon:yes stop_codon:yes gene_type:complete